MGGIEKSKIDQLNTLHNEIMGAMRTTLHKAVEAGGILQEVKENLPHGKFTAWVEENISFDLRTAQRYMKAWDNRDRLKNDTVSSLKQLTEEPTPEKPIDKMNQAMKKVEKAREEYIQAMEELDKEAELENQISELFLKYDDLQKRIVADPNSLWNWWWYEELNQLNKELAPLLREAGYEQSPELQELYENTPSQQADWEEVEKWYRKAEEWHNNHPSDPPEWNEWQRKYWSLVRQMDLEKRLEDKQREKDL
jgi:hypothetical protein